SFIVISNYINEAKRNGSKVFLLRLPLHEALASYENKNCSYFIEDIRRLANQHSIEFLDFNEPAHLKNIGSLSFYIDGQHVDHPSSQKISKYI
ncbi:hypothetical protein ACSTKJ_00390, partial [Vibrio parahaemolyticus]